MEKYKKVLKNITIREFALLWFWEYFNKKKFIKFEKAIKNGMTLKAAIRMV